jgi:hypothetical protein
MLTLLQKMLKGLVIILSIDLQKNNEKNLTGFQNLSGLCHEIILMKNDLPFFKSPFPHFLIPLKRHTLKSIRYNSTKINHRFYLITDN